MPGQLMQTNGEDMGNREPVNITCRNEDLPNYYRKCYVYFSKIKTLTIIGYMSSLLSIYSEEVKSIPQADIGTLLP